MFTFARRLAVVLASAALLITPVLAQAQDGVKIGFVNTDRLLREAAPAKAAQAKLEQEFSAREKTIDASGAALKAASDKFERDAVTMNETQRAAQQRKLADQDREFQRSRMEFQEDLNARKQEELQRILDQANRIVQQVAIAGKYDVILQEAVYVNPKLDITDQVIKALNEGK
ncbi:MAG: OmpH family outer membrane protein [Burkholderiaceae bacterium]|jgi:outer membrane protein|nr:MAG: OmpH family outer membrane protein [Burkholderiaceae bacterium]